jgi:hypothetical protein
MTAATKKFMTKKRDDLKAKGLVPLLAHKTCAKCGLDMLMAADLCHPAGFVLCPVCFNDLCDRTAGAKK